MSKISILRKITQQEDMNFLLANRIPRRYATLFMGWFSRIENPIIRYLSLSVWKLFADDLELHEARKSSFKSLHDCFTRELKPGARSINQDKNILVSPCDAIIGAHGKINGTELFQAKGFPYTLNDLLMDEKLVEKYQNGFYITLRLTSTMYHHFHAPYAGKISEINYISGDTWNVNPIALKRVEKLFCKNERAIVDITLDKLNTSIAMVPVAAILVSSIKFHCLPDALNLKYKGPNKIPCQTSFNKGDELGYFQHGSTIIVFATSKLKISNSISEGNIIRMGESLFTHIESEQSNITDITGHQEYLHQTSSF
ncbi:MAG: archaetidylserine decarboxylase [Gammaproteobacteria bacterium]|nr:archaetidylserine decarboxylase [Gammaproteobacteria bacterium]